MPSEPQPSEPQSAAPSTTKGIVGKVKEAMGWATADRRVEAEGELDQLAADEPVAARELTEDEQQEALDEAELRVRSDHGDLTPEAEPDDAPRPGPTKSG